jgi:O-acetyl-ADP-ribose deacetylase (regulator of RNase III)
MINYEKSDLLDSPAVALVNTVNLVGVMGKGIALQFKQAFPHNYEVYRRACREGELGIGKILAVYDRNLLLGDKLILNVPTKTDWRLPSQYDYVNRGLTALRKYLLANRILSLAVPALGCGNGGLDWGVIRPMIEQQLAGLDCAIFVYEP